jgi:lysophospholipase L1-like esterase
MYVKVPPGSRRQRKPVSPRHNAFRPVFTEKKKGAAPLNWRLALRVLMRGIGIASFVMVVLGLMSGTIRSYVSMLIDRQVARAWPSTYAVVGDSLAAECPWKWSFGLSPLAVTNLAVRGADLRDITHQIDRAHYFRPQVVIISGGINDLINNEAPLDAIRFDFALLLRRLGKQKSIVTLIPYISDRNFTNRITAANEAIAELAFKHGTSVLDINPLLSAGGVRRPEMTRDGIHLSALACQTWIAAVKSQLAATYGPAPM